MRCAFITCSKSPSRHYPCNDERTSRFSVSLVQTCTVMPSKTIDSHHNQCECDFKRLALEVEFIIVMQLSTPKDSHLRISAGSFTSQHPGTTDLVLSIPINQRALLSFFLCFLSLFLSVTRDKSRLVSIAWGSRVELVPDCQRERGAFSAAHLGIFTWQRTRVSASRRV